MMEVATPSVGHYHAGPSLVRITIRAYNGKGDRRRADHFKEPQGWNGRESGGETGRKTADGREHSTLR